MARVSIERTTPEDVASFMGKLPYRIYALTMREDDRIIGIGGLAYVKGGVVGFMDIKPDVHRYPVTLHKTALKLLQEARENGYRNIATVADFKVSPAAGRWLERLGFEPTETKDGIVHRWPN